MALSHTPDHLCEVRAYEVRAAGRENIFLQMPVVGGLSKRPYFSRGHNQYLTLFRVMQAFCSTHAPPPLELQENVIWEKTENGLIVFQNLNCTSTSQAVGCVAPLLSGRLCCTTAQLQTQGIFLIYSSRDCSPGVNVTIATPTDPS